MKRREFSRSISISAKARACDNIYELVKSRDGNVSKESFLTALQVRGILQDDPRLTDLIESMDNYNNSSLQRESFLEVIGSCDARIIERAFTYSNLIRNFEKFGDQIRGMYYDCEPNNVGKMSKLIPQLSKQNPDHFGISVCTVDGQRLNIGNTDVDFCLQSCTKPIAYCMALEEHGMDVHDHVGREPSGTRFNALKVMHDGLPHNPLINSGGIIVGSLIKHEMQPADKFDHVIKTWTDLAGGFPLAFSNSAYLSAKKTSDRNFALAHFLKENKAFPVYADIDVALEFYFQCFALTTNTNHLSIVAGSLANGGVCPLTGEKIFSPETVKNCLSMMYSCGMYDYSGEFAFTIGLPACSGESGAIMVVIPNVMGVVTYSPPLDPYGNSTRGVHFFARFTNMFNFHLFDTIESQGFKEDPRSSSEREEITVEKIVRYSSLGDISALKRLRPTVEELTTGDYDYRTPLHLASSNGHLDVVDYLLSEVGFEHVNPIDRWNGTPYDDALRDNHTEVAEYLRSVGGRRGTDLDRKISKI